MAQCSPLEPWEGSSWPSVTTGRRSCYNLAALDKLFQHIVCKHKAGSVAALLEKHNQEGVCSLPSASPKISLHSWRVQLAKCNVHSHPACRLSPHSQCRALSHLTVTNTVLATSRQYMGLTGQEIGSTQMWKAGLPEVCLVGDYLGWEGQDSSRAMYSLSMKKIPLCTCLFVWRSADTSQNIEKNSDGIGNTIYCFFLCTVRALFPKSMLDKIFHSSKRSVPHLFKGYLHAFAVLGKAWPFSLPACLSDIPMMRHIKVVLGKWPSSPSFMCEGQAALIWSLQNG